MIDQTAYQRILSPYVKSIWSTRNIDFQNKPNTFKFFADGCPGLMYQQAESGMYLNDFRQLSTLFLYGQTVKPITLSTIGNYRMIVFFFYPHVMKSLFGVHASELTDTCVDISLLPFGSSNDNLVEKLLHARTEHDQIILLQEFMVTLISANQTKPDEQMQWAVSQITNGYGNKRIKEVQEELSISERTLTRRFEQHVGVSPKLFSNICRFRASLDKLESGNFEKLSDIAFESGYADQSHFIRSFKEFAGETPRNFLRVLQSH